MKLAVRTPEGTAGAIALVARSGPVVGGTQITRVRQLPAGGSGFITLADPGRYARVTAVLINADVSKRGFDQQARDWRWLRDDQRFDAVATTDFRPPRLTRTTPGRGASGVSVDASVRVNFSEPMLGIDAQSLTLVAPNDRAVRATIRFRPRTRVAVLTPRRPLRAGTRYRIQMTDAVTDAGLNPLRRTPTVAFRTEG
jgi:hypothetical protein